MPHETFRPGVAFRATAWTAAVVIGLAAAATLFCAGWGLAALLMR